MTQNEKLLLAELGRKLAASSFKRKGRLFSRSFSDTFVVLEIQPDKNNSASRSRFTCNYGGGSRHYFDAHPAGFTTYKPQFGLLPFSARAGAFSGRDLWLDLEDGFGQEAIQERVSAYVQLVAEECTSLLSIFSTRESLLSWMRSEEVFGITDFARERVIRILS
jgi:hypothetical protein